LTLIFLTAVTQKGPVWHLGNTPKTPAKKKEKEREKKQKRWIAADFRVERGGGKGESKKSLGGDFPTFVHFFGGCKSSKMPVAKTTLELTF